MKLERTPAALLFNPFAFIAGGQALGAGLMIILGTSWVGRYGGAHFDGVLDTHIGWRGPLWFALAEGMINWLCATLVLLAAGKLISSSAFRVIDLAGTQALARWPLLLVSLACLPPGVARFSALLLQEVLKPRPQIPFATADALVFFAAAVMMFICTVWMCVLMYQSFSICCNVRGTKAIVTFIAALLVAEVLSKIAIVQLLPWTGEVKPLAGG
jgi:hypothetical protein